MPRKKVADIQKLYARCQVFFMTADQEAILKTALEAAKVPQARMSKAIRRSRALTIICWNYIDKKYPVMQTLNRIKCSAAIKQGAHRSVRSKVKKQGDPDNGVAAEDESSPPERYRINLNHHSI